MRAIERTTRQFVAAVREVLPQLRVNVQRSVAPWGRSNYVYIYCDHSGRSWKIRISDHAVGMSRALGGRELAYISAGAKPDSWAVWLGQFRRVVGNPSPSPAKASAAPLLASLSSPTRGEVDAAQRREGLPIRDGSPSAIVRRPGRSAARVRPS